jgi:cytochrome P450
MQADPLGFYSAAQSKFGDYVKIRVVAGVHCFLMTHPDAVEHVLHKNYRNFRKPDRFYKSVGLLVGNGLFTNEGEAWQRQRQRAQPAFHRNFISQLTPLMVQGAQAFVAEQQLRAGQPLDMMRSMTKVGMRIASTTLFSADISGDADVVGRAYRVAFAHISRRLNSVQMVPNWFPSADNRSFARAKRLLDEMVMGLIATRRASAEKPRDLLTMLMEAQDQQTGERMSDRQLMDEVLTLLTAGHENIGAALAWTWYLIGTHPDIQRDLHAEIDAQLKDRAAHIDDLGALPLLSAVFAESLRLYPPGWGELRESIAADEIAGYPIPAKAMIILCQWVTHRHPDFWVNPDQFDPTRFLHDDPDRHRFAYFPFGGGPRICIGLQFAMIEGPLVLATILQKFRIELVADQEVVPDATFTLLPKNGLKVILHPRGSHT